jgi:hypothetical protein
LTKVPRRPVLLFLVRKAGHPPELSTFALSGDFFTTS